LIGSPDIHNPHTLTILSSSHINAETPGSIHEGGELGYALAVSFGAAMDNPDLIVPCVIGDGEAESGPTATYVPRHLS
jgi:phosphoketolase